MRFQASFDTFCKVITAFVFVAVVTISAAAFTNNGGLNSFSIGMAVLMAVALVITYGFHPRYYEVNDNALLVKSLFKTFAYTKDEISNFNQVEDADMKFSIRTFGVGGLFGYFGKFYNSKIGKMTWFATQRKNWLLLQTVSGKKVVITPDRPLELLKEYQKG